MTDHTTKDPHTGSCLCKTVKYQVEGSFETFFFCHCRHCQKDTGSAHAANLFSTNATLRWLSGEAFVSTFILPGTRHTKSFCQKCGSALPNLQMQGKLLVVPAGSLDTEVNTTPTAHIFCASRATWDEELELVQRFEKLPL
ncbi:MAG TPA: GFA family protein [Bdellovibrionota bacterium]|nr:GFA family protein [Bdellovibrionota bacterium]